MTSEQQPSSPQPQDQRVSFQLPPDTTPTSSPLSSPLGTTFPAATALAAAAAVTSAAADEPNDPSYDSDNEPSPRDCIDCEGVTNETLLEGQIVKSGYLMKKGERIKIWKKKWFVLRTSKLAYYKDDKEYEIIRIIDLHDVHRAAEVPAKHSKSGVFLIMTPQKTYTVQAQSVAEMKEWVEAINQAKTQFDFTVSSSDLDSYPPTILHGQQPQLQEMARQQALSVGLSNALAGTGTDVIVPKWQNHEPLSLSDPDLHDKRERSRQDILKPPSPGETNDNGNSSSSSSTPANSSSSTSTTTNNNNNTASNPDAVASILASPLATPTPGVLRRGVERLSLITTGAQATQTGSSSSPRMEHIHSNDLSVGSLSSEQSYGGNGGPTTAVPGTPSSPGGYNSGGEFCGAGHDYLSSDNEDDAYVMVEAGRLASQVNLPGSGIVTDEQIESKIVLSGYLLKLGNKYKTWRKKWFVLRGEQLTYYKNNKEYQPHGIIPLSTIIDCLQTDPVSKSKQYCLRIVTVKRSFMCSAPDEDTLLQWLDALHVEVSRVAMEAKQEEMADHKAHQLHRYHSVGSDLHQQDGHDGDGEDNTTHSRVRTKPLGRTARLKINLHNSLPRSRARSGDGNAPSTGLFGSHSPGALQIRKVLSLDSAASSPPATPSTPTRPNATPPTSASAAGATAPPPSSTGAGTGTSVTFQLPGVPNPQPALPSPSATATFSA
ncbi:hypothetical protein BGX34_009939 [Mortierella sp. NVP85]|nr:hypothetical protein BGX34_009939 [Mortierella sp. NVP85]